jgi:hypothetical protein
MSVFENLHNTTDKATDLGEKYIKTSHQYFRLKIFQQISFSISLFAKLFAIGSLIFIAFIFLAICSAIAIGDALENAALGYLIVGGIFIIFSIIMYFSRRFLETIVIRTLSEKFFN